MKEKTSITLSTDVLAKIEQMAGSKLSRSAFIEFVLRGYFRERARRKAEIRDVQIINAAAERLNLEAEDVLGFQTDAE
jgi:metal-responsive CopG/Arc/MetJ family transcriptional regulator